MRLRYELPVRPNQLLDELLAAVPILRSAEGTDGLREARVTLSATGGGVEILVPDDADQAAIGSVVGAHVPVTPTPLDYGTEGETVQGQAATVIRDLKAFIALASPTAAQQVAATKLLCRVALFVLRRMVGTQA